MHMAKAAMATETPRAPGIGKFDAPHTIAAPHRTPVRLAGMVLRSPVRFPPAAKKHAQDKNPTQVMSPRGVLNSAQKPARTPAVIPIITRAFIVGSLLSREHR